MNEKCCRVCGVTAGRTTLDTDGICVNEGACLARVRRASTVPKGVPLAWPWRVALTFGAGLAEMLRDHELARALDGMLADDAALRWRR